ncbi:MAG: DUF423 domain-containing protein [Burkholderiaceae bacterium]
MSRLWLLAGAISAFVSVAAGAFGAHALKASLDPAALAVWETASRYQMVHALALVAVALGARTFRTRALDAAGAAVVLGTLLFSGSLYALAFTGIRGLGMITPIGGVAFLAGWACLGWAALRER